MSEISKHTRELLHNTLADATALVWKMQHALTENPDADSALIRELSQYAEALGDRAAVTLGAISRWQLSMEQSDAKEEG